MFNLNNFDFFSDDSFELASSISSSEVVDLLQSQGWILFESTREFDSFRRPKEEPEQYVVDVPKEKGAQYAPKILDAAFAVALFEKRPIVDVLNDWKTPRADRVALRVVSDREEKGSFRAEVVSLTALKRDGKGARPSGVVVFRIFKDDGSSYDAETFLNADDFQIAYDALAPNDELSFEGRVFWKNGKPELSDVAFLRAV